jgi:hypothetical protein
MSAKRMPQKFRSAKFYSTKRRDTEQNKKSFNRQSKFKRERKDAGTLSVKALRKMTLFLMTPGIMTYNITILDVMM